MSLLIRFSSGACLFRTKPANTRKSDAFHYFRALRSEPFVTAKVEVPNTTGTFLARRRRE